MKNASLDEYNARMHRVLEHFDRHLDQTLDLNALAAVANFSPFHFHRVFTAWMGETFGDYLRRRRLEVAAMRLASQPKLSVRYPQTTIYTLLTPNHRHPLLRSQS